MICNICNIDKPVDSFYTYYHSTQQKMRTRKMCKNCYNNKKKNRKVSNFEPEPINKEIPQQEEIIQPEPPELEIDLFKLYMDREDPIQAYEHKPLAYEFLTGIGWKYNPTNGIWYDNKLKDSEGIWNLPKTDYLFVKERKSTIKTDTKVLQMTELRKKGWTYARIADKFDVDDNTVIRWLRKKNK